MIFQVWGNVGTGDFAFADSLTVYKTSSNWYSYIRSKQALIFWRKWQSSDSGGHSIWTGIGSATKVTSALLPALLLMVSEYNPLFWFYLIFWREKECWIMPCHRTAYVLFFFKCWILSKKKVIFWEDEQYSCGVCGRILVNMGLGYSWEEDEQYPCILIKYFLSPILLFYFLWKHQ